jgi:aspartyl/asparaginyl-tRNA synthetase
VRSVCHLLCTVIFKKRICICKYANNTGSDAEGAGEMFKVTALPFDGTPRTEDGKVNYKEDFFGKETNLTVSGQLEGETFNGFGSDIHFGPEPKTRIHLDTLQNSG